MSIMCRTKSKQWRILWHVIWLTRESSSSASNRCPMHDDACQTNHIIGDQMCMQFLPVPTNKRKEKLKCAADIVNRQFMAELMSGRSASPIPPAESAQGKSKANEGEDWLQCSRRHVGAHCGSRRNHPTLVAPPHRYYKARRRRNSIPFLTKH